MLLKSTAKYRKIYFCYRILVENLRERDHMGDPGVDGRIMLRWFFRKWDVGEWTGTSWFRIGLGCGHL
jgi:hypothetical protein